MDFNAINEAFRDRKFYDNHPELISAHLSRFFKEDEITVFHEMLSPDFHLDVYFINAPERKYNILLTSGMSLLEMRVPDAVPEKERYRFAELILLLPKTITFGTTVTGDGANDWIIEMLKETARFPHHYNTWLAIGHTMQASADMEPYHPATAYTGVVVLPSVTFDEDFTSIPGPDGPLNIYSLFPLYRQELKYKVANGYNALLDCLIAKDAREIFDFEREALL